MIEETTLSETPALIIPPGYDARPRRWRAVWALRWHYPPSTERAEGHTIEEALDALLLPLCREGTLRDGDEPLIQIFELDDEVPSFWNVRIERDAAGAWCWSVLEKDL